MPAMPSKFSFRPSFASFNPLGATLQRTTAPLRQRYSQLAPRDQIALAVLTAFLLVLAIGLGGWTLHQRADAREAAYNATLNDVFWLRSQAGNINANQSSAQDPQTAVQEVLSGAGIDGQIAANADGIEVAFSHAQAPVINNVLNQLVQRGFVIERLQISQTAPDGLRVQALFKQVH